MSTLQTQSDFRKVQRLPFCYLCGKLFKDGDERDRDHVPSSAMFAETDRQNVLWLPTHKACNQSRSKTDEQIGQLVAVSHGKYPRSERVRLDVKVMDADEQPFLGLRGINLHNVIGRWVRGFHATIYKQFLPGQTPNYVHVPFPTGNFSDDGSITFDKMLKQHYQFVEIIKKNRVAGTLDRIVCFNSKCIYECVWARSDEGIPICVFALQIYDWKKLSDSTIFRSAGVWDIT